MRIRILQVIPRFNPKHGGGVDVVYNVSKYLNRLGHEVTVITTDIEFDDKFANTIRNEGVNVIPFKHLFNYCLFIPSPEMKKWLSQNIENYDIIHLNGARSYQNNIVCKYAIKYNIPYVMQAHGSFVKFVSRKGIKEAYDICWGNRIFKNTTKFIALAESEKEAYENAGVPKNKIEIIPNGVDLAKFENLPEKGQFRKKYCLGNENIVLYLGRLHKSKGIDLVPEMYKDLLTKLDNVRLVFVGPDDGYGSVIKERINSLNINNKVLFTGLVSEEDKFKALVDADVFITPKFYGFPISFLEAWACGLPVITTNEGDQLPWIDNYVGYVANYTTQGLSEATFNLLTNTEQKQKYVNNAKLLIEQELNWSTISKKLEMFYDSCY